MSEPVLPLLYKGEYWLTVLGSRMLRRWGEIKKKAFRFELGANKKPLSMAWF